jgi:hypothetical protein
MQKTMMVELAAIHPAFLPLEEDAFGREVSGGQTMVTFLMSFDEGKTLPNYHFLELLFMD